MIYKAIIMSRKIEVMRDSGSEISLKKKRFWGIRDWYYNAERFRFNSNTG